MATGSGYVYKTLPNELRMKMKCQLLAKLPGENFMRLLGDTTSVTGSRTIEETEVFSNETPDKDLALVDQTKNDLTLNMVLRQLTPFAKRVLFQSDEEIVDQAAKPSGDADFVGVSVGDMLPLGWVRVKGVVVKSGDTVLDLGVHYNLDSEMGRVQINAFPNGVGGAGTAPIKVTFAADAAKVSTFGLSSKTDLRSQIVVRQNNKWGPSFEFEFWDVQVRPDGDMPLGQDGDEFGELTVIGRVYADSTKPAAYRLGRVRQIPKAA